MGFTFYILITIVAGGFALFVGKLLGSVLEKDNNVKIKDKIKDNKDNERFKLIVENINELVIITGSRGIIEYVNPWCEKILGYTINELTGKELRDVSPQNSSIFSEVQSKVSLQLNGSDVEYKITSQSGEIKWVSHSWSSFGMDKKVMFVMHILRDITECKKKNEELQKYKDDFDKMLSETIAKLKEENQERKNCEER